MHNTLLVDLRGIEPRPHGCKPSVLPLSLEARWWDSWDSNPDLNLLEEQLYRLRGRPSPSIPYEMLTCPQIPDKRLERTRGFEPPMTDWQPDVFPLHHVRSVKPSPRITSRIERHCTVSLSLDPARRCFLGVLPEGLAHDVQWRECRDSNSNRTVLETGMPP